MATATTDQTVLYEQKFSQNFEMLVQQQDIRIADSFRQGDYRGSKGAQVVKQIGLVEMDRRTVRLTPVVFKDVQHDARWVYPTPLDAYIGFDTWDELMTAADPRSEYNAALVAGMNRAKDDLCIAAFIGDAKTGETGGDTTAFDTANQSIADNFGASAATHLTLAKIKEGKRILLANEVDLSMEKLYCSARATDISSLMDEVQVVRDDYSAGMARNAQPVLRSGTLESVFGVQIIHSERHQTSASDTQLFMWSSGAMSFGTWQPVQTKIVMRDDLRMAPWQVGVWGMFGSTRLQEKKIVRIMSVTA